MILLDQMLHWVKLCSIYCLLKVAWGWPQCGLRLSDALVTLLYLGGQVLRELNSLKGGCEQERRNNNEIGEERLSTLNIGLRSVVGFDGDGAEDAAVRSTTMVDWGRKAFMLLLRMVWTPSWPI